MHSGMSSQLFDVEDGDDLSSYQTPMTASCSTAVQTATNVEALQNCMDKNIQLNTGIKAKNVAESSLNLLHEAEIRELIKKKRKLRKKWQKSRNIDDKKNYNQAIKYLKKRMDEMKNEEASNFSGSSGD